MSQTESIFSISKRRRYLKSGNFLKPGLTVLLSIASIATIAVAGSLTPPAAPASTFHTLEEIYNSIAGTFDSSGITSSTTGSLIQGIKSINSNLAWASGSNNVWALNSGNVGIGTTSPTTKLDILGSASVSVNFEIKTGYASISNTLFVDTGTDGRVGIGTTVPTQKLEINYGNLRFNQEAAPGAPTVAINPAAGNLDDIYTYAVTFVTPEGETELGSSSASVEPILQQVNITNIPTGSSRVTSRNIYRSINSGVLSYRLVTTINNNTTTSYTDNISDGSLVTDSPPTFNTTGGGYYLGTRRVLEANSINTVLGYGAGVVNREIGNIFIGTQAGGSNTVGIKNTALGYQALYSNITSSQNTAVGYKALYSNTDGYENVALGYNSLTLNTSGFDNIGVGNSALGSNTTGYHNTVVGVDAVRVNTTGYENTVVGTFGLFNNTTGIHNTAMGYQVLFDLNILNSTGDNTVVGYNSGRGIVTGINNTIIGANVTGLDAALSGNIIIADGAGNQRINVGSTGFVGIGTTAPTERLQVSGKILSTNTEVQGTSSASYGLFGSLQVAGFSSTSYSRFGTNTTGHSLSASQDLLLSGNLEVDGQAYFDSNASVSGTFEITKLGTTGDHFKLTDSANDKSYGFVVRDGDLIVRAPSISDSFSSRYSIASVASNSLGWTLGTPASPSLAGSYATAQIALDIYVQGKYAYVPIDVSGIQIIDVSNPHSPVLMSTLDTSGTALGVYVSGRYLYVGDSTAGLHIIDVSTPKNPIRVGTYNTSGNAENIYVSGKYAYVTDNASGLQIIDVSNPSNPILVSTYDTPDLAEGIYVSGKYAYIGDNTTFRILDISNPSSPTLVGVYDTPDGALGIYVSGKYAYVGGGNTGLVILDVSNPSLPTLVSTFATTFAESVYVSGEYAYVADSSGGVKIVDVSNPSVPILAGSYTFSTNVLDVYVSGKYVYAAGHAGGLKILDIGGLETHALYAGNINTSDITVSENIDIGNSLLVRNGLNVGNGGLLVNGPIALSASFSANTASLSASDLFTITHSKGRLTGDALQMDLAASTSQEFFTGNFANFTTAGTTRILFESSGSILASGAAQFGSASAPSSVSYSRFGTGTTDHSLSAAQDLLLSGSLEVDGTFYVDQLSDQHGFVAGGTGNNRVTIRNTTAGTGNYASFAVVADNANTGGNNQFFSTTYSTSGSEIADSYRVISLGTGGLSLAASSSGGGVIRFYSGSFSAERARFDQIGRLGLGTTTPLQELHIASGSDGNLLRLQDSDGTCDHNPEAGAETVTCSSDSRLKDNIVDAAPILNRIKDIRIRDYIVKASGDQMTGVIAQEIRETWPEMVASGSDGFLMVRQPSTWQIIKAIQEQQAQISEIASKSSIADESFLNSIVSLFEKVFGIIFKNGLIQSIRGAFETVETDRLCVGNTCVTEKELIDLLQRANVPQARPTVQPTPTPAPTVEPIPYTDPTPTPADAIPTQTPTPDVSPTVSPAPADATPTPADILPIISPTPTPTSVPTPTPADVTPIPTPIPSETPITTPVTTPADVPPII